MFNSFFYYLIRCVAIVFFDAAKLQGQCFMIITNLLSECKMQNRGMQLLIALTKRLRSDFICQTFSQA